MKNLIGYSAGLSIFLPAIASAQFGRTSNLILMGGSLIDAMILLAASIALLLFFWGLAKFIFKLGGDAKAVEDGKQFMIWGVIALFVLVSIWGLVRFIQGEFLSGVDFSDPRSGRIR